MTTCAPSSFSLDGAVALSHCGLIRAHGKDAATFLHGQLTNDIAGLAPSHARLAGYCSAKGRMLASFIAWKPSADEVLLICSADLVQAMVKRLSMFVLRAQLKLTDASRELQLFGLAGSSALNWLQSGVPQRPWEKSEHAGASVIRLPDVAGQARFLWVAPLTIEPPVLPPLMLDAWQASEVDSAIARIEAATTDQFVPQMLNYEQVGGVDFKKGCYPGQEVVARSQYRGTIKRRSFLFRVDAPATPGQEIFHSGDPSQPAGRVVNAAYPIASSAGSHVLAEIKLSALESGTLHFGEPSGPQLVSLPMPYEILQGELS